MIAGAGPRLGVVYPSSLRLAQAAKRWVCRESREGGYVRPVFLWNASNPALLGSISPQIPFAEKRPAAIAYPPEDSVPAGLMNRLFMLRRFLRMFVPPFAALLLIAVAGIGAEYWLQGVPVQRSVVTGQSELSVQTLLQPSAVCHHQLRAGTRSQLPGPSGNSLTVRINSRGLRGAELSDDPAVYRILLLGDDTVFGASATEKQTLAAQLQACFADRTQFPLEVLNGGVPGYCPLLCQLRFAELAELRPNLVIVHVDMSDVDDDTVYRSLLNEADGRPVCIHPAKRSAKPGPPLPLPGWLQNSALFVHAMVQLRHEVPPMLAITSQAAGQQQFTWITDRAENRKLEVEHTLHPLIALRSEVEAAGGRLLVATCPVIWQLADGRRVPEMTRRCRIRGGTPCNSRDPFIAIAEFCARERLRIVDASEQFRQAEDPLALFNSQSPVPSTEGLELYAKAIADYIVRNPPRDWEVQAPAAATN